MRHRRDIEGLRAVAVLAVLLFHFGVPGTGGGFVGVDVFFVISGFLITTLLLEERAGAGRVSILRFYARRARRLLPISTVVLVATAVAGSQLLQPTRLDAFGTELRAAALFGANLLFADRGADYLTASLEPSPVLHFWSLAVEEQFYVVWPALIALVTAGATAAAVRRRTAVAMGGIVIGSYALSGLLTSSQPTWAYYGLHTRAWELGLGALLAATAPSVGRLPATLRAAAGWAGIAGIVVSVVTFDRLAAFPGWAALLPVASTAAVLAAGDSRRDERWAPNAMLRLPPLQYLGSRSYSLYLWHWPALVIAEAHHGRPLPAGARLVIAVAVLAVAECGYRLVEHPIRSSPRLGARPMASIAVGAILVGSATASSAIAGVGTGDLQTGVIAVAPALATTTSTTPPSTTTASVSTTDRPTTTVLEPPPRIDMTDVEPPQAVIDALDATVLPDNLRPPALSAINDVPIVYDNGCHLYMKSDVGDPCAFGAEDHTVTVALWGDSHAAQWFSPLEQIALARGWRLLVLTQGGCPFLDVAVYNLGAAAEFRHCESWRESVRATMREEGVDVVLMSQYHRLVEATDRKYVSLDNWRQHLPGLLDSLRADGIEPIVLGDVPKPELPVPACVVDNRSDIGRCAALVDTERVTAIDAWIRTATAERNVGFVEPLRWICVDGVCPPVVGDLLAYRDDDHLSNEYALWLGPLLDAVVGDWIDRFMLAAAAS